MSRLFTCIMQSQPYNLDFSFSDNSVFKARKTFYLKLLPVDFRIQVHSKHTTVIFKFASLNIH